MGPPEDDAEDYQLEIWAGVLPMGLVARELIRDERCDPAIPVPGVFGELPHGDHVKKGRSFASDLADMGRSRAAPVHVLW